MEIIVKLLWSVEGILFLWGIVQMRFQPKLHRIGLGVIVVIIAKVFCVCCPNTLNLM